VLSPSALTAEPAGYEGAGWSRTWLVIATEDELGDPIFAELDSPAPPVYTAAHGEATWDPVRTADSFDGFVAALREVQALSAAASTLSSSRRIRCPMTRASGSSPGWKS
jgi:hypothetical protein